MKKQIKLYDREIEYTLKMSRRARMMRLVIYRGGDLTVTAPQNLSENAIERFIIKKSRWVIDKITYFKQFPAKTSAKNDRENFLRHKENARKLAERRLEYFNGIYKFKCNRISIRNQKTRWGSCSAKGNINFNYKIALLPERLADYIIVHELCHLGEFNHSRKFWNLVAKTIPDYREIRSELQRKGINFY